MIANSEKQKFSIRVDKELIHLCDQYIDTSDKLSRTAFIENALKFYIAYLTSKTTESYISNALTSAIAATVQDSESRVSRSLFKLAVEIDMMMNVIASMGEVDKESLARLRGKCIEEVKRSIGSLKFEDTMKYQHSKE